MMYPFMPMVINPALAGQKGVASITGIYRKKPLFQPGLSTLASSQQYFSFDMPILKEKGGIGFWHIIRINPTPYLRGVFLPIWELRPLAPNPSNGDVVIV